MTRDEFIKAAEKRLTELHNRQTIFRILHIIITIGVFYVIKKYITEHQIELTSISFLRLLLITTALVAMYDRFLNLSYYQSISTTTIYTIDGIISSMILQSDMYFVRFLGFIYLFVILLAYVNLKSNVEIALNRLKDMEKGEY